MLNKQIWVLFYVVVLTLFLVSFIKEMTTYVVNEKDESEFVTKYHFYSKNGDPMKYVEAMRLLTVDPTFRETFIGALRNNRFPSYFFETPPVNKDTCRTKNFEFVLVNSKRLSDRVDPNAFSEHFTVCKSDITVFTNIGGDAVLIAPCPTNDTLRMYAHLATFLRHGHLEQIHNFLKVVGDETMKRIDVQQKQFTWLSTSGLGVSWLHMRLDSRPKYYTYTSYKEAS